MRENYKYKDNSQPAGQKTAKPVSKQAGVWNRLYKNYRARKTRINRAIICISMLYIPAALPADGGFYADLSFQYVINVLNGAAKDKVYAFEPGINAGWQFGIKGGAISAGLISNLSIGLYDIRGDLQPSGYKNMIYDTATLRAYTLYRFDLFPYVSFAFEPSYWIRLSIGVSPEFSIYQYTFNAPDNNNKKEMVGTQTFGLGLIPQIQFRIYDNIIFGFRIQIVPFTFTGKSVYVYYGGFENEAQGYKSHEVSGMGVQNHVFKFGIFAGYAFGNPAYRSESRW